MESVLAQLWDKRVSPHLLDGVAAALAGRIRMIACPGRSVSSGAFRIQEKRCPTTGMYSVRCSAWIRRRAEGSENGSDAASRARLHVHLGPDDAWAAPNDPAHAARLRVVIREEKLPSIARGFLPAIRSARYEDGFEATASFAQPWCAAPEAEKRQPKTVLRSATETFAWVAPQKSLCIRFCPGTSSGCTGAT
jgi:hypothetical protein